MKELLSYNTAQIKALLKEMGQKPFVAGQLIGWLAKGAAFSDMTNLSAALRERLAVEYEEGFADVAEVHTSKDGTAKYLLRMSGGGLIECVVMRYKHGSTLCVSTQIGCAMRCVFCASGQQGLVRNLSVGEMRSQFIAARQSGEIGNVVLMGSGEPLLNYDNVVAFIRALGEYHGIGIRHVSLSTCGIVPGILRLADEGLPVTLCISLHAAIDEKRRYIMPGASEYTVSQILGAANMYFKNTGRRIIIEYTLIRGFNDLPEDIGALSDALGGMNCHINVIPLNAVPKSDAFRGPHSKAEMDIKPPGPREAHAFAQRLNKAGMSATVRRSLGSDIEGACGQLKMKREGV